MAKRLEEAKEPIFVIEQIQPTWLNSIETKNWYRTIVGLITLLIVGIPLTLFYNLLVGLFWGGAAVIFIIRLPAVKPVEKLGFSWEQFLREGRKSSSIFGLVLGTIIMFMFSVILGLIFHPIRGLIVGLILMFFLIIYYLILHGLTLSGIEIEKKRKPNQGIWLSLRNALILGVVGVTGGIIGVLIGSMIGGLVAVIQHISLRFVLFFNGDIPWNYEVFLKYAAKHRFIQPVGGRYYFMHDLLRKHFANMPLNRTKIKQFLTE